MSLVRWHHRPALLRDALHRFVGMADWKRGWHTLAVPTESFFCGGRSVFDLAKVDQKARVLRLPLYQLGSPGSQPTVSDEYPAPADRSPVCGWKSSAEWRSARITFASDFAEIGNPRLLTPAISPQPVRSRSSLSFH